MDKLPILCECNSFNCQLCIMINDIDQAKEFLRKHENGEIVIIDGCKNGPETTDVLIEKCDGYSLYREG